MSEIGYIINNLNTCLLSKLEHEPPSAWQCLSVSSFRLNYKSLKNRCHSSIYFDLSLCLWLTVCLVILVGRKKSHSHHFWVVFYQLIVPGPFSCSAVDQSLLIFLFLPLLPGSHSQQTRAHLKWLLLPFWRGTLHRFLFLTWTRLKWAEVLSAHHCTTGVP